MFKIESRILPFHVVLFSSGKVAAGTGGEEEVDGVSLCVFVVFHIREISQEEIRI